MTDQAARLWERYRGVWDALEVCRTEHAHLSTHRFGIGCPNVDAALDTLIAYHRAVSAVEAWQDALAAFIAERTGKGQVGTIGVTVLKYGLRPAIERALAAARARLAAYEEEQP